MPVIQGIYLVIREGQTAHGTIIAIFAAVLIGGAGFMLFKKLKRLQKESSYTDNLEVVEATPAAKKPVIKLPSAAPAIRQVFTSRAVDNDANKPPAVQSAETSAVSLAPASRELLTPTRPEESRSLTVVADHTSNAYSPPAAAKELEPAKPVVAVFNEPLATSPKNLDGANFTQTAQNNGTRQVNAILNSLSDIIFEYDENKVCINLWYNKGQKLIIDLEIFRGKTVTEAMGAEKGRLINDALDYVAANGISTVVEFQSFFGSGKWFSSHISPVFDDAGDFTGHTTSLVTDITEQKESDEALLEKHRQLIEAQKIAGLGDWSYNAARKKTTWSDNLYAMLGIDSVPKGKNHFEFYASCVHPEDRRGVYQFFADLTGDKHPVNQHRIYTKAGKLKVFRIIRGLPVKDAEGKPVRVSGIIQDVSGDRMLLTDIKRTIKTATWKWSIGQRDINLSDEVYDIYEVDKNTVQANTSQFQLLLKHAHPEDRPKLLEFFKNSVNLQQTSYNYRVITPEGKLKYLTLVVARVKEGADGKTSGMMGTLQDVTEFKEVEIGIRQADDNYKQVLETIKLAALSLDKNGNILFCNKYLTNLLGYEQEELAGKNWRETFVSENLRPVFREWHRDQKIKPEYINPVICKDGEERVITWQNTTIYDTDGQIRQTTCIGEDVTEQQKDRQQLVDDKEKAERTSAFKSQFLSTMSHEIRTPMNAVIGTTNLLLQENPRADQLTYLNNLKFSGENLLNIIDDILDYNKIDAGKLELNRTALNVHSLTANVKQTFLARAMEKQLNIVVDIDERIPENLLGDPTRISQILNNLVSNAIKFTDNGDIKVSIHLDAKNDTQVKLNFNVSDTGIGIDSAHLDRIFEPFVQEAQQRNYGGTGLGLAIIKRLLELHGSRIRVKSALGRGTQFNFDITFDRSAAPVVANKNPAPKVQEGDLSGMKVLIVDDNKMNILIVSRFLTKWNIVINEANNGLLATQMVDTGNYDLILMDLQMPVMDGFEATKIIKLKHPDLPVIALTADAMPETFSKTMSYGMDDYLTKPFMPEVLFEKISRHYKTALSA